MRTKRDWKPTALQRQALECVRGAKAKGVNLSKYCRARGVAVRQVYDALIPLRRRGLLPAKRWPAAKRSWKSGAGASAAFMAVQVAPPAAPIVALVKLAGGISIECRAWPPRAWLQSLGTDGADAAA